MFFLTISAFMKAVIVDDNAIARATMKQLAGKVNDIDLIAECSDALEAYNVLQQQTAELIFLDIEMPGMTGLQFTRNLAGKKPVIIFITSKKDYAVEAFELNVADYVVKPITPVRFIQAVDKAREILNSHHEEVKLNDREFIFIRDSNIVRRLKLDDILFAEAMGDYVKLHTVQKFYAIHTTLKQVEEKLPASRFTRVHRSYIVSVEKIDTIQDGALIINGKPVPVADGYRASLNKNMDVL